MRAARDMLPDHDFLYLGDTLHVPYGKRSKDTIYDFSKACVSYLFEQGCALVITACNTVSAAALRRLQQEYLPSSVYSGTNKRILGVVVPTLEAAIDGGYKRIGVLATQYTVQSAIYELELKKINPAVQIYQAAAPLLVPMIEENGEEWILPVLEHYLEPLLQKDIECLILGCTHYPRVETQIQHIVGDGVRILSQNRIIPEKLRCYLERHPEIDDCISKTGKTEFHVTDLTENYLNTAGHIYGNSINLQKVTI